MSDRKQISGWRGLEHAPQRMIFASQQKGGLFYLVKDMCVASVTKVLRSEAVDSTCLHQLPACFLCPNPRATSHLKWAIFYGYVK